MDNNENNNINNSTMNNGINQNPNINVQQVNKQKFMNIIKKNKKKILIISLIIVLVIALFNIFANIDKDKGKNEKILECSTSVDLEGEYYKKTGISYTVKDGQLLSIETIDEFNLKHPKNNLTEDDIKSYKNSCEGYNNDDCQVKVYNKNNYMTFKITISGDLLSEKNNNYKNQNLTDDEIIQKIKENEEVAGLRSCSLK